MRLKWIINYLLIVGMISPLSPPFWTIIDRWKSTVDGEMTKHIEYGSDGVSNYLKSTDRTQNLPSWWWLNTVHFIKWRRAERKTQKLYCTSRPLLCCKSSCVSVAVSAIVNRHIRAVRVGYSLFTRLLRLTILDIFIGLESTRIIYIKYFILVGVMHETRLRQQHFFLTQYWTNIQVFKYWRIIFFRSNLSISTFWKWFSASQYLLKL